MDQDISISRYKMADIERRESVPADKRTPGKDVAADWIEENIVDKGEWPMDMQDLAEESDWSRQHVTNTVRDYFRPVGMEEAQDGADVARDVSTNGQRARIEFDVPPDVDRESYVRGYLRGWVDGKDE